MLGDWADDDEDDLYSHFVSHGGRKSKSQRASDMDSASSNTFMFVSSGVYDLASGKKEGEDSAMQVDPAPIAPPKPPKASKKKVVPAADQPLGAWERFTKGAGSKMLEKMGWKGGGLGIGEKGIVQPLQAVARSSGTGLAEGDYMGIERSVYRPDEATMEPEKEEIDETATPTGQWKKDAPPLASAPPSRPKAARIIYKTAQEIQNELDSARYKQNIVDMRAPTQTQSSMDVGTAQPFISQFMPELRHNLNHLVDVRVSSIHSLIKKRHYAEQQTKTLSGEESTLKNALAHQKEDISYLKALKSRLSQIKEGSKRHDFDYLSFFRELKDDFRLDYEKYRLDSLIFHYVFPHLENQLAAWRPLYQPEKSLEEMRNWKSLLMGSGDVATLETDHFSMDVDSVVYDDGYGLSDRLRREKERVAKVSGHHLDVYPRMVYELLLPKLRAAINEWDVQDPDPLLNLLALWKPCLTSVAYQWLLYRHVAERLKNGVQEWRVEKETGTGNVNLPLDTWVAPWLPLMGSDNVPELMEEIRRKLQQLVTGGRKTDRGVQPILSARDGVSLILPWKSLLDASNWALLVARGVMKRIETSLRHIEIDPASQDLEAWNEAIIWSGLQDSNHMGGAEDASVVSPDAFGMALLESGFWQRWFSTLGQWFHQEGEVDLEQIQQWYSSWKQIMPKKIVNSPMVQPQFKQALQLMLAASNAIMPPLAQFAPVKVDLRQLQRPAEEEAPPPSKMASTRPVWQDPTLKELLQETAEEIGQLFLATGRKYEGNQIYKFGKARVYLDRDLVYVYQNETWKPTSVNTLIELSK